MDYEERKLELTIKELTTKILEAYTIWIINGRRVEGIYEEELVEAVKRLPPAKWIACWCDDPKLAVQFLNLEIDKDFELEKKDDGEAWKQ